MGILMSDNVSFSGYGVIEQGKKYQIRRVSTEDKDGSKLELTVDLPGTINIPPQVVELLKVAHLSRDYELIIKDPSGQVLYRGRKTP